MAKYIDVFLVLMLFICSCDAGRDSSDGNPGNDSGDPADVFDHLPGPDNTGYTGALQPYTGPNTITTDGTVMEDFSYGGTINIDADNVVLRNFFIDGIGMASYCIKIIHGHSGILIEHGEMVNMLSSSIYGAGFTARYLNIHESGSDGIKAEGDGGPTLVEYCWFHHLGTLDGAHADGNQTYDGHDITFRYNNFDLPHPLSGNPPGGSYKSNAAFTIEGGDVANFVIEYNYMNGGNYTIYRRDNVLEVTEANSGTYVRNNYYGRDYNFGIRSGVFVEWSNNRFDDNNELIP